MPLGFVVDTNSTDGRMCVAEILVDELDDAGGRQRLGAVALGDLAGLLRVDDLRRVIAVWRRMW